MNTKSVELSPTYQKTLTSILQHLGEYNAYTLTMPLLLTSATQRRADYNGLLEAIKEKLGFPNVDETTHNAWLLGRLLVAATEIKDDATEKEVFPQIVNIVHNSEVIKDAFRSWALGYLGMYYAAKGNYAEHKDELLDALQIEAKDGDESSALVNVLFVYVIVLQAVAIAKDMETYKKLTSEILTVANQSSLAATLEQIPLNDFRAWAMSWMLLAAARVGDEKNKESLQQSTDITMKATQNLHDKELARINSIMANF